MLDTGFIYYGTDNYKGMDLTTRQRPMSCDNKTGGRLAKSIFSIRSLMDVSEEPPENGGGDFKTQRFDGSSYKENVRIYVPKKYFNLAIIGTRTIGIFIQPKY
ncbi:hypothetical protein Phum_PHUM584660 [Pediculus humanus corporis]|uniref:Uncharacterized protein n=1 Tax=Pediculus humanus subsp. corporis TaxID=121224 RepID=E0W254_PEDHC|nr:uncharacterized protein Phum_PHUM584660 [Pediculus humanus corporis]EEB19710.1 hypothetical protein Phum_PHUM584660 [Pediculus humanus corporis]